MNSDYSSRSCNPFCETCATPFHTINDLHGHLKVQHIANPKVVLNKLSSQLQKHLKTKSYKYKTGKARSRQLKKKPLKICLKTSLGGPRTRRRKFTVVNSEVAEVNSTTSLKIEKNEKSTPKDTDSGAVEGSKLLERLGANFSYGPKVKNESEEAEKKAKKLEGNKDLLDKLSGIGVSFGKKSEKKEETETAPSGVSIASKSQAIDIAKLKPTNKEETKSLDKDSLLQKLSGIGGISFGPKAKQTPNKPTSESEGSEEEDEEEEGSDEEEQNGNDNNKKETNSSGVSITKKSEDNKKTGIDTKTLLEKFKFTASKKEKDKEDETDVLKRFGSGIKIQPRRKSSQSKENDTEKVKTPETENPPLLTGIHLLERMSSNLGDMQLPLESQKGQSEPSIDSGISEPTNSPTPSEQLHPDFMAPPSECGSPTGAESMRQQGQPQMSPANQQQQHMQMHQPEQQLQMQPPDQQQQQIQMQQQDVGLPPTLQQHQVVAMLDFQQQPEQAYADQNFVQQNMGMVNAVYTQLDPNAVQNQQQGYWQPDNNQQQQPMQPMPDNVMQNDKSSESILQNFLQDTQMQANLVQGGTDFLQMDNLNAGMQQQQQQPPPQDQQQFDPNMGDPNTQPMQQLTQQVQRLPAPPTQPQISVVPQHQLLAQQPPPSMSPHQQQQQQPPQFPDLSQIQPNVPQIYQPFNMYNQQQQQPQGFPMPMQGMNQMNQPRFPPPSAAPRPPSLQQRPRPRLVSPRASRPRMPPLQLGGGIKRPAIVVRSPQQQLAENSPNKQRRIETVVSPGRPNQATPPKLPSGVTLTPPKKTNEASKVANVLASRGITITPNANRPQPRSPQRLTSGVSITSGSSSSGGFAVPGPRRPGAIINHNVDRPERCTTVDLTLDDDPPPAPRNRFGRHPCTICPKVFTSSLALQNHKATHRAAGTLAFKCDQCSAQYPTALGLKQHKVTFHKTGGAPALEYSIPVVDMSSPSVREKLYNIGIVNYIPLTSLRSTSNGVYGFPIGIVDPDKDRAYSTLNSFGANNYFTLGKLKSFDP